MYWREALSLPFTRIAIVSQVPSESGVYGVFREEQCVLVGNTWNLKAHLLELITGISGTDQLSVKYELLPEETATERAAALNRELKSTHSPVIQANGKGHLHGLSFWDTGLGADPSSAHDA